MGAKGLTIADGVPAPELRRLAVREPDRAKARRLLAIANALEGMTRAEAARLAGMERQALRDAVLRYNVEGLAGLSDRPRRGRQPQLDKDRQAALRDLVVAGPEVERTGLSAWTLPELCREVEARWGAHFTPSALGKVLHRLGLSRQKARPAHPKADPAAREAFAKGGCRPPSTPRAQRTRISA
jgi:transposase